MFSRIGIFSAAFAQTASATRRQGGPFCRGQSRRQGARDLELAINTSSKTAARSRHRLKPARVRTSNSFRRPDRFDLVATGLTACFTVGYFGRVDDRRFGVASFLQSSVREARVRQGEGALACCRPGLARRRFACGLSPTRCCSKTLDGRERSAVE